MIDVANATRAFGSELGCFLLLDRVDKSLQIDCSVLNRNGEHGRPPRLRSNPRLSHYSGPAAYLLRR